jgi:flagellar hook assembly protein FlgD
MPTASAVESDRPQNAPKKNALHPAYPNPFNQSTGITFYLNKPGPARLTIFNAQGRVVRTLLDEQAVAGSHYLTWDGMTDDRLPCPSGAYFVFLQSAEFTQKRALTLVR